MRVKNKKKDWALEVGDVSMRKMKQAFYKRTQLPELCIGSTGVRTGNTTIERYPASVRDRKVFPGHKNAKFKGPGSFGARYLRLT